MKPQDINPSISLVVLLAVFLLSSGGCMRYPVIDGIEKVDLVGQSDTTITVKTAIRLRNRNTSSIPIKRMQYTLTVEGVNIGGGNRTEPVTLRGNDTTVLELTTPVNIQALAQVYPKIMNQDSSSIEVDGVYTVHFFFKDWHKSVKTTSRLDLFAQVMKALRQSLESSAIKVEKTDISQPGLQSTTITTDLSFTNNLSVTYQLDLLDVNLYSSKKEEKWLDNWKLNRPKVIQANSKETIQISLTVRIVDLTMSLPGMVFNGEWRLFVKGYAYISLSGHPFKVPVEYEVPMDVTQFLPRLPLPRLPRVKF